MKLYFYCSSSSLLEYFTVNKIVCNDYLANRNRKIIHSLGLVSEKFLFITPKKLKEAKRSFGFDKDYMEIGTVIEFTFSDEDAKSVPVLLLDDNGRVSDDYVSMSEIKESNIGVFVKGEIPFSYITGIFFNNDDAKDDIYRPSKDLYFPEQLYSTIDNSFSDDVDGNLIVSAGKNLDDRFKNMNIIPDMVKRNKITSIILNIILETKNWPFGEKHKANFDDISAGYLDIVDRLDEFTDGKYSELKDVELKDEILGGIDDKDVTTMAPLLKAIVAELLPLTITSFSKKNFDEIMEKVLLSIAEKYTENQVEDISKKINLIEDIVYGSSNYGLEKLLSELPRAYNVLKALTFFLRSPLSTLKLLEGLSVYKAEPDVCRYAWVMFSALNGLEPISSEKTGNDYVMRIAESKAMKMVAIENSINSISSECNVKCTFIPTIEEDVSPQLVRALILSDEYKNKLPDLIKLIAGNKTLKKGFKESSYKKLLNPFKPEYLNQEYISQKEVDEYINEIKNRIKKAKFLYDTEKFLIDNINDEKAFSILYKKDEEFWKAIYKNRNK